jgi:hypothetical protein
MLLKLYRFQWLEHAIFIDDIDRLGQVRSPLLSQFPLHYNGLGNRDKINRICRSKQSRVSLPKRRRFTCFT